MGVVIVKGMGKHSIDEGRACSRDLLGQSKRRCLCSAALVANPVDGGTARRQLSGSYADAHCVKDPATDTVDDSPREGGKRRRRCELGDLLGKSGFGHACTTARGRTGEPVAPKIFNGTRTRVNSNILWSEISSRFIASTM